MNSSLIGVDLAISPAIGSRVSEPYYQIYTINGTSCFTVDFVEYKSEGISLLFLSPYQLLIWHQTGACAISTIRFHSDFYCIEYHKREVACNGVLFNNIYSQPHFPASPRVFNEICYILPKMKEMCFSQSTHDIPILKTYLQLILALGNREKLAIPDHDTLVSPDGLLQGFRMLLEQHFLESRSLSFYAGCFGLSVESFSKKVKRQFGKPPSVLIQERIVLEAKRMLHLTHMSVKEIAAALNIEDEFYFSRYFKRAVGVSPKVFRQKVGISAVAG